MGVMPPVTEQELHWGFTNGYEYWFSRKRLIYVARVGVGVSAKKLIASEHLSDKIGGYICPDPSTLSIGN